MLTLLLAIHNHQPDGNFGHVFENAYEDCYRPVLDALLDSPHVRCSLHHTGALLEWIERERPAYFEKMRTLVGRGQVELLGGGFYEPMLAVLPERDALGQIAMMSDYLERHFGVRPEGMWLAERVWEPALAKTIADAGLRFTLLDDGHFRSAGIDGKLRGYYVTEKSGRPLAIFPIDMKLRQAIPFSPADKTITTLVDVGAEVSGDSVVTYGDDGEKFGVWPQTKEWVWEKGWLREFFEQLRQRNDVTTGHFGTVLRAQPPSGRVYLPTASYEEMGEWALPAAAQPRYLAVRRSLESRGELEAARPFVRGGIWQAFLAKYPEANFMHKRMIAVSAKLERAEVAAGKKLEHERHELYRAQCNCCYWHGLFGGLYLNYLRDAVYRHLIEVEIACDKVLATSNPSIEVADLDADFQPEIALCTSEASVLIKPDLGGAIYSFDYRPKRFNLLNVLSRHHEGYHERLRQAAQKHASSGDAPQSIHDLQSVKSAGLEELLIQDRHLRLGFVDHFLSPAVSIDELVRCQYQERGDFVEQRYEVVATTKTSTSVQADLRRRAQIAGRFATVDKRIALEGAALRARYSIAVEGDEPLAVAFAPEITLTLLAGTAGDRYYRIAGQSLGELDRFLISRGEIDRADIELANEWDRFVVGVRAEGASLIRYGLETASQSEAGFERTYQGSVLLPIWRHLVLRPGQPTEVQVAVEVREL